MAEGIAGSAPPTTTTDSGSERTYLMSLCEAGQQYVTVTKIHKKSVDLMFMHANSQIRCLDEVIAASDVCDRTVMWSVRYLVDKADLGHP